jgi:hypothetical protein
LFADHPFGFFIYIGMTAVTSRTAPSMEFPAQHLARFGSRIQGRSQGAFV